MHLVGYVAAAKRWWWTLLVATWVAGLSGYLVASQLPRTYEAEVRVLVGPINADIDTLRAAGELVQTYAELATSQPLLNSTAEELGGTLTGSDLQGSVHATANNVTRLLTIRVQRDDAAKAALVANTLADELTQLASRGASRPEGELQVVDRAVPINDPIAPQVSLIALLSALAGLLGAFVLALLVDYLSGTIRTGQELSQVAQVPLLGGVDTSRGSVGGAPQPLLVESPFAPRAATAYRLLTTKIIFSDDHRPVRSLLVIGADSGDGAGEVAANLAAVLGSGGRRVTLVDANRDRAEITNLLGLQGRPGMSELLAGGESDLVPVVISGVNVLPHGAASDADVIDWERARSMLDRLLERTDVVVLNAAPVHRSAGTLIWARTADTTVLVARRDHTKREDVLHAVEVLRLVGANLVGTVVSQYSPAMPGIRLGDLRFGPRPLGAPETVRGPAPLSGAAPIGGPAPPDGRRAMGRPRPVEVGAAAIRTAPRSTPPKVSTPAVPGPHPRVPAPRSSERLPTDAPARRARGGGSEQKS